MYYGLRGLSLIALPFTNFTVIGLSAFAVSTASTVATVPPTVRLTAERFGSEKANLTFGWIFTAHQLGAATAAFGAGFSRSDFADLPAALYVAGVAYVIAAALVLTIGRRPKEYSRRREPSARELAWDAARRGSGARSALIQTPPTIGSPRAQSRMRKRCRGQPAARLQPLTLVSLGIAAPLSAKAAGTCTAEALTGLNVPDFTVASAKPAQPKALSPPAASSKGRSPRTARGGTKLGPAPRPASGNWNGKLVFFGVGGLAGSLDPSASPHDFVSALGLGYATAITDTGHVGKSPFDADWVLEAPGKPNEAKIVDYFYRAPHQAAFVAKALAAGFYGAPKSPALISTGARSAATWGSWRRCAIPTITTASSPARRIWIITLSSGLQDAKAFLKAHVTPDIVTEVNEAVFADAMRTTGSKTG